MSKTINTTECEKCIFGKTRETSKKKVSVWCEYKNKEYKYGQIVPCDNRKRRKN